MEAAVTTILFWEAALLSIMFQKICSLLIALLRASPRCPNLARNIFMAVLMILRPTLEVGGQIESLTV